MAEMYLTEKVGSQSEDQATAREDLRDEELDVDDERWLLMSLISYNLAPNACGLSSDSSKLIIQVTRCTSLQGW